MAQSNSIGSGILLVGFIALLISVGTMATDHRADLTRIDEAMKVVEGCSYETPSIVYVINSTTQVIRIPITVKAEPSAMCSWVAGSTSSWIEVLEPTLPKQQSGDLLLRVKESLENGARVDYVHVARHRVIIVQIGS